MSEVIIARTAQLNAQLVELSAALAEAVAREVLVVGDVYTIQVGKGETAKVLEAKLVGQRQLNAASAVEFRFEHGEGFDARFYDLSYSKVVLPVGEGEVPLSSNKIAALITRATTNLANVDSYVGKVAKVAAKVEVVVSQTYNIKTGKGETAAVVQAVVMAERTTEEGAQEFAVFTGAGFDAKVLVIKGNRFVFDGAEEAPEEAEVEEGIDLDAEYTEAPEA
jgi:uncharacterized protein YxjI